MTEAQSRYILPTAVYNQFVDKINLVAAATGEVFNVNAGYNRSRLTKMKNVMSLLSRNQGHDDN